MSEYTGAKTNTTENENSGDEGSALDLENCAYGVGVEESNTDRLIDIEKEYQHEEIEHIYLGDEWNWNNWAKHSINENIEGPIEYDHYSGPHGLKPNVSKCFLQFCSVCSRQPL